jgi:glutamate/tyrosine decarboxylase-like PLP-dependent enzyme
MSIESLKNKLLAYKNKKKTIRFIVFINFGTTIGGAVDDVFKIRETFD